MRGEILPPTLVDYNNCSFFFLPLNQKKATAVLPSRPQAIHDLRDDRANKHSLRENCTREPFKGVSHLCLRMYIPRMTHLDTALFHGLNENLSFYAYLRQQRSIGYDLPVLICLLNSPCFNH